MDEPTVDIGAFTENETRLLRAAVQRHLRTLVNQAGRPTTPEHRVRICKEDAEVLQRLKTRLNTGLKRVRGER